MSKFLATVCAFGLLLSFASAQEPSVKEPTPDELWAKEGLRKSDVTRYAPSGKSRTVWFVHGAYTDCSPMLGYDVKTTKEPEHGAVEIVPAENFSNFAKDNVRFRCNARKMSGFNVNYKSSEEYRGPDEFTVLVLWPNGYASEARFKMVVR